MTASEAGPVITTRELRRTFKSRRGTVEAVAGVTMEVLAVFVLWSVRRA